MSHKPVVANFTLIVVLFILLVIVGASWGYGW